MTKFAHFAMAPFYTRLLPCPRKVPSRYTRTSTRLETLLTPRLTSCQCWRFSSCNQPLEEWSHTAHGARDCRVLRASISAPMHPVLCRVTGQAYASRSWTLMCLNGALHVLRAPCHPSPPLLLLSRRSASMLPRFIPRYALQPQTDKSPSVTLLCTSLCASWLSMYNCHFKNPLM